MIKIIQLFEELNVGDDQLKSMIQEKKKFIPQEKGNIHSF